MLTMIRKKCLPPTYRFSGTTLNGRLLGSALPSTRYPTPTGLVPRSEGKAAQSWDIQIVSPLEAIVLDGDEVLSPSLGLGRHHPQWKTLFICPLEPRVGELIPVLDMFCTQYEPIAYPSWKK